MKCDCEKFKEYDKWDTLVFTLAYSHGILYPKDGPKFVYCPFCGKKLNEREENIGGILG